MAFAARLGYYRRIFAAYLGRRSSQLTFWHDTPEVNDRAPTDALGEYFMPFAAKADYPGPRDALGLPLLDYHGHIGLQYNPIAIAQLGLGNFNLFIRTGDPTRRRACLAAADWLVTNLERNPAGIPVWNHHFDWEYRTTLKAPWYSALAQGQGISLLVRAATVADGSGRYRESANLAFESFTRTVDAGGVVWRGPAGAVWLEETIVDPPTHILNGCLWALWGLHDYALATGSPAARRLFAEVVETVRRDLDRFDTGYWSLYELAGTRLPMLASPFYHRLHVVQLRVTHRLTGEPLLANCAARWEGYARDRLKRIRALAGKAAFKLVYY